jgi:DNA-binding HxlR family transcriptional regulator
MKELRENVGKNSLNCSSSASDVPNVGEAVEAVFGCKWSIRILELIRSGVYRPGEIERSLSGLTTKVQHHYFRRMVSLGILRRDVFAEVPPRVEYRLTAFGERFVPLLNQISQLQIELEREGGAIRSA